MHWYRYLCPPVNHVKVVWFVVGFYGGELKRSFRRRHSATVCSSCYRCWWYGYWVPLLLLLPRLLYELFSGQPLPDVTKGEGVLFGKLQYLVYVENSYLCRVRCVSPWQVGGTYCDSMARKRRRSIVLLDLRAIFEEIWHLGKKVYIA